MHIIDYTTTGSHQSRQSCRRVSDGTDTIINWCDIQAYWVTIEYESADLFRKYWKQDQQLLTERFQELVNEEVIHEAEMIQGQLPLS